MVVCLGLSNYDGRWNCAAMQLADYLSFMA